MSEYEVSLTSILRNPHFVQLASIIHVPFIEYGWSRRHPEIPARTLINQMSKIAFDKTSSKALSFQAKQRFLGLFASFTSQVMMADMRLHYTTKDMEWLVEVLDSDQAKVTLALLFGAASCAEHYFTPAELAALLEENETVWRRKAKRYEVPGTIHKSRGWLIPLSGLRSIGLLLDYRPPSLFDRKADTDSGEEENRGINAPSDVTDENSNEDMQSEEEENWGDDDED